MSFILYILIVMKSIECKYLNILILEQNVIRAYLYLAHLILLLHDKNRHKFIRRHFYTRGLRKIYMTDYLHL